MGLMVGMLLKDICIFYVFIGLCINGCIEDLCVVVKVFEGCKIVSYVCGIIVSGLIMVRCQVEEEGLVKIFIVVGFEWWQLGCLMCFVMNEDVLLFGDCCVLGMNCNFFG